MGGESEGEHAKAADSVPLSKNVIRDEPLHGCAFNGATALAIHVKDAAKLVKSGAKELHMVLKQKEILLEVK